MLNLVENRDEKPSLFQPNDLHNSNKEACMTHDLPS